jgi:hypothetical protein
VLRNEGVHTALCDFGGVVYNMVYWEHKGRKRKTKTLISDCFSGYKFVCAEREKAGRKIRRKTV